MTTPTIASDASRQPLRLPAPLYVRLLAILITGVFSGLAALALVTGHVGERWTRLGYAGPLEEGRAQSFGLAMLFFGLLPLMLCARTPRSAMWVASISVVLGLICVFAGALL
ncbi:hypothetical protein ACFPOE_13670 [Caenimonas terrae]|uniref:DUF1634 domain-containing protein n=1 Tax=Caenimonas terrae TaxID=696074 RepID=A0ABW0ND57_9BURK